jgi:RNA polymerase sigma-70 factor, ECF subfamily
VADESETAKEARLTDMLVPIHDRARATARRLCGSRAEGDDLFHEAVLRAFDRLDDLRDVERFRPWFYAVMLSVHRARHRRSFWRRFLPFSEEMEPIDAGQQGRIEGADRMARALATLSPEAREAIVLFELDGFSIEEIAELQRQSPSAVKSRLARGRASLRLHYERSERRLASPMESQHESR